MINNDISAASPGVSEPGPPRRRLPAATRVTQILDAALQVFSDKGFASARLDDIAEAAGLSKGGVYTHFASKEEIFGALLKRLIQPPMPAAPEALADEEPVTVDLLVRRVVEPMYQSLGDPSVLQAVRLLLANGTRVPQAFDQWHQTMFEPHIADVARLLQLVSASAQYALQGPVAEDMRAFIDQATNEADFDPRQFKVNMSQADVAERLRAAYGL